MTGELQDPARAFVPKQPDREANGARFAPADNLYDAIRSDVVAFGGIEFETLGRRRERELPFNDIDENPFDE